jgi:hypothetical protein
LKKLHFIGVKTSLIRSEGRQENLTKMKSLRYTHA